MIPNTSKTEIEESSELFKELSDFLGSRSRTKEMFWRTKETDFINEYGPLLQKHPTQDDYTFESIWRVTDLKTILEDKKAIVSLENKYGGRIKGEPKVYRKYEDAVPNMRKFNASVYNDTYIAKTELRSDGKWGLSIYPKTRMLATEVASIEANYSLNERLASILSDVGVGIGALTEMERKLGIKGVADMDLAKTAGEHLVTAIRVANGDLTDASIPEEATHIFIAATKHLPLTQRLLENIRTNNLARNILGDQYQAYYDHYSGDLAQVAEEAAGKLVADYLIKSETHGVNKNLLDRVWNAIKDWVRNNLSSRDVRNVINSANKDAGDYAQMILTGSITPKIKLNNISTSERFFNLEKEVNEAKDLLDKMILNVEKKLRIYANSKNESFTEKQQALLDKLNESREIELFEQGVYIFMQESAKELKSLDNRLNHVNNMVDATPAEKAAVLRGIYNFTESFGGLSDDIRAQLREDARSETPRYNPEVMNFLNDIESLVNGIRVDFSNVASPVVMDAFKPFMSERMRMVFTDEMLAEELKRKDKDISPIMRWIDSAVATHDTFLNLFDKAVKMAKHEARLTSDLKIKELYSAHLALEKAGVKNTAWMAERDENGKPTGRIITDTDYPAYHRAATEARNKLNEKYGVNPEDPNLIRAKSTEWSNWKNDNLEKISGSYVPRKSIYGSKAFNALNQAQKAYYEAYMNLKQDAESKLPEDKQDLYRAVMVRKDLVERIKASTSAGHLLSQIGENIKEQFIRNTDDIDFGGNRAVESKEDIVYANLDFSGREIIDLPIFFTRKIKDMENLSLDMTSNLAAFINMAYEYGEKNKVLDVLELGRLVLREREVLDRRGGKKKWEVLGKNKDAKQAVLKKPEDILINKRIDDFLNSQFYGRMKNDAGSWHAFGLEIDKAKTQEALNRWTSINFMGGNVLAAISNAVTATFMTETEAWSGEYFNHKELVLGEAKYQRDLPAYMAQIGMRVKNNKLHLIQERFNILQDYNNNLLGQNMDRNTRVGQLFGMNLLFFMQNAGEHWMQTRTALAQMERIKLVDKNGNRIPLYNAYEVITDKNGVGILKIKEGLTKEDGTQWSTQDEFKLERKMIGVNEQLHGIYNKTDSNAAQMTVIGRLLFMFRGWMWQPLKRRYDKKHFNADLDQDVEGFYRTAWSYVTNMKEFKFNLAANWSSMSDHQKANMKRFVSEQAMLIAGSVLTAIIFGGDDDDTPDSYSASLLKYQLLRLMSETSVYSTGLVTEGMKMIQSPAAGMSIIEDIMNATKFISPYHLIQGTPWKEIESGRFKGKTQLHRALATSPFVPVWNTVRKATQPEEQSVFYLQ
jgi:hypothetical protein